MSRPGKYYPDGYAGGGELPDDLWIDRMVYPERPPSPEEDPIPVEAMQSHEAYHAAIQARDEARERANLQRDRDFAVTLDNITGTKTGPPRTP